MEALLSRYKSWYASRSRVKKATLLLQCPMRKWQRIKRANSVDTHCVVRRCQLPLGAGMLDISLETNSTHIALYSVIK